MILCPPSIHCSGGGVMSIEEIMQALIIIMLIPLIAYLYIVGTQNAKPGRFHDLDILVAVFLVFLILVWLTGFRLWTVVGTAMA